ncbi:uncharacterized protein LOC110815996 [Carica papaya]|uniref:uncharacterized protein LOC110815996 n=1 Tax=Carica papaya TaxID=3649 RepID=UPI000B8CE73A|nr:uncharacterized protein LOC110815996 [Carica papaya]
MALPLGKLTIIVGAGIVGSVLAKEGRMSHVSNFLSGAFKIVFKQLRQDDSSSSVTKPRSDSLMAQVNSLRQELQVLASNRPIMIVTTNGTGGRKYGIVIVIVVVGYGYVWWKGWKLPDFMFATRRSLADACNSIGKQLENVYSSISAARRHLSSRIDRVDAGLDEIEGITTETGREVSELREGAARIGEDVRSVRHVVETLESKISRIEGKQDITTQGVKRLCDFAQNLEQSRTAEQIQASPSSSSRPALDAAPITPSSRTASLPPISPRGPQSPSAPNGSHKDQGPLQNILSSSGLKEVGESSGSCEVFNGNHSREGTGIGFSSSGLFGLKFSGLNALRIMRTRSAINASPQQSVSSREQ